MKMKIPEKHIWAVLKKIKEIKRHMPDDSLLRYPMENFFDKHPGKGIRPVDEVNALYQLEKWGFFRIDHDEPTDNEIGMIFYLELLPKFEREYPDYEKKYAKHQKNASLSGLDIADEDDQQLIVRYNSRVAKESLTKKEQFTHILYYIINNLSDVKESFTDQEILDYLAEVDTDYPFSPPLKANKSADNLRKSRNRHLGRIEKYLQREFPVLKRRKIYQPITGGFNWLLK